MTTQVSQHVVIHMPRVSVHDAGESVTCRRPGCRANLGHTTTNLFRRSGSGDFIEAPATIHLRCGCGYVSTLTLTGAVADS